MSRFAPLPFTATTGSGDVDVVLLHGFLGSASSFSVAAAALAGEARRIVRIDLPGHGAARTYAGPWSFVDLPAVVGATIDAAGCERPALVGYSMGARAALSLVVDDPARFAGALLESGSPGIVDDAERARRVDADEELARALETQPLSTFVDRWYAQPLFASLARRTSLPSVKAAACTNDAKALARALRGLGTGQMPPLWDALPRLSLPLRLVVGREDARYVAIAQAMRERATHAVVDVIEGAGHNTHIEEPRAFLRALHGFLQQVAR